MSGMLALLSTLFVSALGLNPGVLLLRLWPLAITGAGMLFVLPPLLVRDRPGLGALFIPGFPVLMTGTILTVASVFNVWRIWEWVWPLELLSLATGFLVAAVYTRVIWLLIPAFIIGCNALVMQFCAITGWWSAWSVLWGVEPLSLGLALLVIGLRRASRGLTTAGLVLCGIAGVCTVGMAIILAGWFPVGVLLPLVLLVAGAAVLAWGFARHRLLPRAALE